MLNRILSNRQRCVVFVGALVLLAPVAVAAQEAEALPASMLVLTSADGTEAQYQVTDVSVYLSSSPAYDDVPASTSMSLSLSTITPVDAALLQWAAQTTKATKASRDVKVTASMTDREGKPADLVYDVTGANVGSVSVTNSIGADPSISLTIDGAKLLMNGVAMN